MARVTKESKIINNSQTILENLNNDEYTKEKFLLEYENLLNEYIKLSKKYDKTITLNDTFSNNIFSENEQLEIKINETVKQAREKILEKISIQNKSIQETKELQTYVKNLENDLDNANLQVKKLEKKIKYLIENDIEYKEEAKNKLNAININQNKIRFFSFNQILNDQISKAEKEKSNFIVLKLTIDNYNKIKKDIEKAGSEEIFLKGTLRYLQSIVSKNDIVYFSHQNIFYFIFENTTIEKVKKRVEPLNKKREVAGLTISFSIGATKYIKGDTMETVSTRCNMANDEASLENTKASFCVEN